MSRIQLRNANPFYYALYSGKTAKTDANGNRTGEYTETYGSATKLLGNVSPASGSAKLDVFGVNTDYSRTITVSDKPPITETTVLWLDFGEIGTYDTAKTYAVGAYAIYSGVIYKATASATGTWDSSKWSAVKHNYVVSKVASSLGYTIIAVKETK